MGRNGSVTSRIVARRPAGSNLRAAHKAVLALRRRECLDETGELVAVLLLSVAGLLDETMAADSEVPAYARGKVARVHSQVIAQLRDAVVVRADDAWLELLDAARGPGVAG